MWHSALAISRQFKMRLARFIDAFLDSFLHIRIGLDIPFFAYFDGVRNTVLVKSEAEVMVAGALDNAALDRITHIWMLGKIPILVEMDVGEDPFHYVEKEMLFDGKMPGGIRRHDYVPIFHRRVSFTTGSPTNPSDVIGRFHRVDLLFIECRLFS
jgi:hypothetical protein